MNQIFIKARAAADHMRKLGYSVEMTTHPTSWGNSAYVTARRTSGSVWIERGFRLSDHGVSDRRKAQDDFSTIIDDEGVTIENLVGRLRIDEAALNALAAQAAERSTEKATLAESARDARRLEEARHLEKLRTWLAENCPEYERLNGTERKKARKRANLAFRQAITPENSSPGPF